MEIVKTTIPNLGPIVNRIFLIVSWVRELKLITYVPSFALAQYVNIRPADEVGKWVNPELQANQIYTYVQTGIYMIRIPILSP